MVERRRRAGRVQLPEAVLAEAVARHPLGDPVQRLEGGGAGIPAARPLPQRRRCAEQPGGALVAALASGDERHGAEAEGDANLLVELALHLQAAARGWPGTIEVPAQEEPERLQANQVSRAPDLVLRQPVKPPGDALVAQVKLTLLQPEQGIHQVELCEGERVADAREAGGGGLRRGLRLREGSAV